MTSLSVLASEITYGTEFNFTSDTIARSRVAADEPPGGSERDAAIAMKKAVLKRCPECKAKQHRGKFGLIEFTILFPDGWDFNISVDPGCVEIQTQPGTLAEIEKQIQRMQSMIFDAAADVGLFPHRSAYEQTKNSLNAHLNIGGLSAYRNDPEGLLRFISDYANHPAMGRGLLGASQFNAPLMSELKPSQQIAFQSLLSEMNHKKVKSIQDVVSRMHGSVYTHTPSAGDDWGGNIHYQAVGLKQLEGLKSGWFRRDERDAPFELRAIKQPETADLYLLMVQFFEKRIKYLKSLQGEPLIFIPVSFRELSKINRLPSVRALEFALYSREMGVDWKTYERLVPEPVRNVLRFGTPDRLLRGEVRWGDITERELFFDVFIRNALVSPKSARLFLDLMEKSTPKPAVWNELFTRLVEQSGKSSVAAKSAYSLLLQFEHLDQKRIGWIGVEIKPYASQVSETIVENAEKMAYRQWRDNCSWLFRVVNEVIY